MNENDIVPSGADKMTLGAPMPVAPKVPAIERSTSGRQMELLALMAQSVAKSLFIAEHGLTARVQTAILHACLQHRIVLVEERRSGS